MAISVSCTPTAGQMILQCLIKLWQRNQELGKALSTWQSFVHTGEKLSRLRGNVSVNVQARSLLDMETMHAIQLRLKNT